MSTRPDKARRAAAPEAEQSVVDGTVKSVVYHNDENGYTVLHVTVPHAGSGFRLAEPELTVVGNCAAIWEGEELHAVGRWEDDAVHGRQFHATAISCIAPKSVEGVRRYLSSGLIKGIGKVLAARIVAKFGEETLDVLDHHSGRLSEVGKLGPVKIAQIQRAWRDQRGMREVMIFTQTYGISVSKTSAIYRRYGADTIAVRKADPCRLCRDIWGIGFKTADAIALSVGIAKDSPLRARAAIDYTLETEAEEAGHCYTGDADLLLHAQELVGISVEILADALKAETEADRVVVEDHKVFLRDLCVAERRVAKRLQDLMAVPRPYREIDPAKAVPWAERKMGFTFAPAQAAALSGSLRAKVSIITGGPGVGDR